MTLRHRRFGRLLIYVEPRDAWVDVYVAPTAVYVCPVPFVVIKWSRRYVPTNLRHEDES
jgi:hypothetical protein